MCVTGMGVNRAPKTVTDRPPDAPSIKRRLGEMAYVYGVVLRSIDSYYTEYCFNMAIGNFTADRNVADFLGMRATAANAMRA